MIHIMTGSTLGGAEYVGDHLSDLLQDKGYNTTVHNEPKLGEIPAEGTWLLVTSTHGSGEYPDNIKPFIEALQSTPPRMAGVKFAVVAIGDSSYDTFCAAGKNAYALLKDIGGTPITDCFIINILDTPAPEDPAEGWLKANISKF